MRGFPYNVLLPVLLGIAVGPASGELIPLDGTVAIVNDDIILGSEVSEQVTMLISQLDSKAIDGLGGIGVITEDVLNEMVASRLLLQKAEELDIVASNEEVEILLEDNLAAFRENFASPAEYEAALDSYGLTEKDLKKYYKDNIRDQLTIKQLVDEEIFPKIKIDEDEAKDYFELHKSEFDVPTTVDISEVVVAKRPTDKSREAVRARALEIRRSAEAGADFGALAREHSAAGNAASGGVFSFRPGETFPELEAAAAALSPGRISNPVELPDGYWLIELTGIDGDTYKTRTIFLPIILTDADVAAARSKIELAYADLEKGVGFEKVAEKYSEEEGTASAGGRVGVVEVRTLTQEFSTITAALEDIEPGEYTEIIERDEGFYIVLLNDREEGYARSYEDARGKVLDVLRAGKVDDELELYIKDIKDRSYIKVFQ